MDAANGIYLNLRIKTIREEVPGFKTIVFEDGHGINYRAGQYLTLVRFHHNKEYRRSYSITSSPELKEPLSIGVKRVPNGLFSRYLVDDALPGDEILSTGAGGFFVLPENIARYNCVFFFAAGSGITPVYSLIKTALHRHPAMKVVLVYSNSSKDTGIFLRELQDIQQKSPSQFYIELLFSDTHSLVKARLHRELIFQYLWQYNTDNNHTLFYICGPENYMRLCTYTLKETGVEADNIKKENFVIDTLPRLLPTPPDKETHTVIIHKGETVFTLPVHYPNSILKSAKKEGIVLPYSCETGSCGSCVATCTKGKIWHAYNEVLTDNDLQKGLVLTCVGHPVYGDAELWL